jgi:FecR-like protein
MFYLEGEGNMMISENIRMRFTRLLGLLCLAFFAAAFALPARAESAGKVLSADGDVLVLRGSHILRLFRGAAVESGDQIHTGSEGKVLVVFTDSGLVWIRANSDFVVDEYSYAQGRREAAFFSLLKGGARSVTGLIGRRTRSNFRLRIPVATIGIRGTDFSVVMCQHDCRDSDGSTAARGLYGEVIEGRIAVTPLEDRLLEREFGAGEFFHLADERSSPMPLFLPPPFLRSQQDEQARLTGQTGIAVVAPGATTTSGLTGTLTNGLSGTAGSVSGSIGGLTGTLNGTLTLIGAPAVPPITLPGTLSTSLPVGLPISPVLRR